MLLDVACRYFAPTIVPPRCDVDATIFSNVPTVVSVPQPASAAATEVIAIEDALNSLGAPVGDQISTPAYGQLECQNSKR